MYLGSIVSALKSLNWASAVQAAIALDVSDLQVRILPHIKFLLYISLLVY